MNNTSKNKNNRNNKNSDFSKINIDTIISFCKKNVKYVSAGAVTVVLVVVLAVTALNNGDEKSQNKEPNVKKEETAAGGEYEVNENEELNKLIGQYYKYYSAGETDKLAKIADPVSDMEKSYVKMMSKYIEGYDKVNCYTKQGLEKNSYMVSATYEMKFKKVDGTVPGMEFFYVRTNKDGKLYIDNLYSSFNSEMKELETDPEVMALIEKFKEGSDVKELQADFQNRYTQALSADEKIQNMVNKVTGKIEKWASDYVAEEEQKKAEAEKKEEEAKKKAEAEKKAEEKKKAEAEKKEEAKKKAEAEKKEEAKKKAEAEKKEEAKKKAEAEKKAEEKKKAEAEKKQQEEEQKQEEQQPEESQNNSGLNYIPEGKVLTANDGYNVRVSMSETSEKIGTTAIGDSLKVILSYQEGWTKVEWNGKTGYIKTDLLLNN